MKEFKNISVLEGNIFACSDSSSLPQNDEYLDKFSCGSETFNLNMIYFACMLFATGFIGLVVHMLSSYSKSVFVDATKHLLSYVNIFESSNATSGLHSFAGTLSKVRYFTLITTAMITLLIPIYSIIKTDEALTTYDYQYGWTPTAAFLSGKVPTVILLVFWIVSIGITLDKVTATFGVHETKAISLSSMTLSVWTRFFALTFMVSSVNAVVIVSANIAYGILLQIGSSSVQNISGIVLSIFKIVWNSSAINIMRRFRFSLLEEEYNACMDSIYGGDVIFFTLILIFNTIISPIVATLLGETNCFRNALYAPDPITSTYNVTVSYATGIDTVDRAETYPIEFTPQFSYSYTCSSFILVDYAPVFVISAIITAFLKPFKDYVYRVMNNAVTKEYNDNLLHDASEITSVISPKLRALHGRLQLLNRVPKLLWRNDEREFSLRSHKLLLAIKKKAIDEEKSREESIEKELEEKVQGSKELCTKILGYSSIVVFSILNSILDVYNTIFNDVDQDDELQLEQILDFESFTLTILTKLTITLTFGIACPLLGITTAVSIILQCWYLQILVGRYLSMLQESDLDADKKSEILKILERDCDGNIFDFSLNQMRFVLIFFSSLFLAIFLMDMSGDQIGWRDSLVYPFVMLGGTVIIMAIHHLRTKAQERRISSNKVYVVSNDSEMADAINDSIETIDIKDEKVIEKRIVIT